MVARSGCLGLLLVVLIAGGRTLRLPGFISCGLRVGGRTFQLPGFISSLSILSLSEMRTSLRRYPTTLHCTWKFFQTLGQSSIHLVLGNCIFTLELESNVDA